MAHYHTSNIIYSKILVTLEVPVVLAANYVNNDLQNTYCTVLNMLTSGRMIYLTIYFTYNTAIMV